MQGEWLRKTDGAATIVFTHGILSNVRKCFTASNGVTWPRLVCEDKSFQDFGVFTFDYFTEFTAGKYSIDAAASAMYQIFDSKDVLKSRALIFVAHSMGGLVVRRFLVARQATLHKQKIKIGLVLVASPSIGAGWANVASGLTFFFPSVQRDALKMQEDGGWLDALNRDFKQLPVDNFLPLQGIEMIESRFIKTRWLGFLPRIVPTINAAVFFPDPQMIPDSDHFSISAPISAEALQHVVLRNFTQKFMAVNCTELRETSTPYRSLHQIQDTHVLLAYIERPSALERINQFLSTEKNGPSNLILIVGGSGTGKSTFMRKRYNELQTELKYFLDCCAEFTQPNDEKRSEYLFVDNLTPDHPFLVNYWGSFGTVATVISTTDASVARECLCRSGVADQSERIIVFEKFSETEVEKFLQQVCGSNNKGLCRSIYAITGGDPLALQISRALLLELDNHYALSKLVTLSSRDEFIVTGFQYWLTSRHDRVLIENIIVCLAVVPYAGMTPATLSTILEKQTEELREPIGILVRIGFLKISTVLDGITAVYSLPTVLRQAISVGSQTELHAQWRTRYIKMLLSGDLRDRLPFELIDAWLVGWQLLFTVELEGDNESFNTRYEKHVELMNAILQKGKAFRSFIERHMTSLLAGRTQGLEGENCAYVIGLAHLCDKLTPKNSLVATHIWPGAYNSDGWARASCIRSAAVHWNECGPSGQMTLKNNIQRWMEYALAKASQEIAADIPLMKGHWRLGQYDYCAALGALCRMNEHAFAFDILTSDAYRVAFPNFSIAHVTLIIESFDRSHDPAHANTLMTFLSLPVDPELPLADCVFRLFSEANESRLPNLWKSRNYRDGRSLSEEGTVDMAATIANQVCATNFKKWLRQTYPDWGTIIF